MKSEPNNQIKQYMSLPASGGMPEQSARDVACLVLNDLDYESQLFAIRGVFKRHKEDEADLQVELDRLKNVADRTTGLRNVYAVGDWDWQAQQSVYEDAARSMSALGMLAPMIESVFHQAFFGVRDICIEQDKSLKDNSRPDDLKNPDYSWDCHYIWSKGKYRKGVTKGILQLAEAIDLTPHLPSDIESTLESLFGYRNKMFHNGFEWPIKERENFLNRITDCKWNQNWFNQASSGGKPWIIYMTDEYIQHCSETVEIIIEAFGSYCIKNFFDHIHNP